GRSRQGGGPPAPRDGADRPSWGAPNRRTGAPRSRGRPDPVRRLPPRSQLPRAPRLPRRHPRRSGTGGDARGRSLVGRDGGRGSPVHRRGAGRGDGRGPRM
ncbi:MAG: hypothetical protein AVDCRST_MAG54-3356, partial [uncultured Actinomycetospora sp.]